MNSINIILDFTKIDSKESLHYNLKKEFMLPSFYGYNLDSFYDIVSTSNKKYHLVILGKEEGLLKLGNYFNIFMTVLSDLSNIITLDS